MTATIITLVFIFSASAYTQQQNPISMQPKPDSLQQQINELKKNSDKEFSKMVNEEVKKQSNDYISKLWGTAGIIISIVVAVAGFLGYRLTDKWLENTKIKITNDIMSNIEDKVNGMINKKYNEVTLGQNKFFTEMIFDRLKDKYEVDKGYTIKEVNKDFYGLMDDYVVKISDKDFITNILSDVVLFLFSKTYYEPLTQIVDKYEGSSSLTEDTWANVAIANMTLYVSRGFESYRKQSWYACEKSLELNNIYAEPMVVKIILLWLQISYEKNSQVKESLVSELKNMFNAINSGSDKYVSFLVNERLQTRGELYLPFINEAAPTEYAELVKRYDEYIQELELLNQKV